ncbi:MAG: hypothetical protein R3272_00275 [Candidatus Promineifilaceae bacterium]|nr:hypothetical protein [Candidatus Promineifilaceae bacterium]
MAQPIRFFDDADDPRREPEEVRLRNLGLFVHEDRRRIALGFDITPFRERPSLEVQVTNERGEQAGSMTVIQAMESNFHLTLHLRDQDPTDLYQIDVVLYYSGEDKERIEVDHKRGQVDISRPGDQTVWEQSS